MEHFIAYHSAQRMGYELEPSGELRFLSKKLGLLKKAVGNTVWIVQGIPDGKKTAFSLCGSYIADNISLEDPISNLYVISGQRVTEFAPPVPLNSLDWFPILMKSQSNFSLGFNRINNEIVIQALTKLESDDIGSSALQPLPDIDFSASVTEGAIRLVSHLRRERNRTLIEAKNPQHLSPKVICLVRCAVSISQSFMALSVRSSAKFIIWCRYLHRQRPLPQLSMILLYCARIAIESFTAQPPCFQSLSYQQ